MLRQSRFEAGPAAATHPLTASTRDRRAGPLDAQSTSAAAGAGGSASPSYLDIEGAPLGLLDRINAYVSGARAQLREDNAGRAAAAAAAPEAGGGGGGDREPADGGGPAGGACRGGRPAAAALSDFQRKLSPGEKLLLMSDLFGPEEEEGCGNDDGSGGGEQAAEGAPEAPGGARGGGARGGAAAGAGPALPPSPRHGLAPERLELMRALGATAAQLDAAAASARGASMGRAVWAWRVLRFDCLRALPTCFACLITRASYADPAQSPCPIPRPLSPLCAPQPYPRPPPCPTAAPGSSCWWSPRSSTR